MRLNQKVALVTSSGSGVCSTTAQQLAREGAKVMLCGRNAAQGLATVRQIRREGGRASFVLADIALAADVKAAINETIATYGRLDILFNHASSRYPRDGLLMDVSESVWDRGVEMMLKGTFFCCQHALPFLQQSGSGTIINFVEKIPDSEARSVAAICQGGVLAMTSAIAQQFSSNTVTANLIWASLPAEDVGAEQDPSEPLADVYDLPIGSGLVMGKILYGPVSSDRPFTGIDEAVMYLACNGNTLHGSALVVNAPAKDS